MKINYTVGSLLITISIAAAGYFGYSIISSASTCESDTYGYKSEISRLEHKINSMDSSIVIDEKIVKWAHTNADAKIPKVEIVRYLREMSKYDNFIMLISTVQVESGFDLYAKSGKGAKGLGQITTSIWADELVKAKVWDKKTDVYDYRKNIAGTNYILNKYLKKFGGWKECLNRYVGGDNSYVLKVLSNYAELTLLISNEETNL